MCMRDSSHSHHMAYMYILFVAINALLNMDTSILNFIIQNFAE